MATNVASRTSGELAKTIALWTASVLAAVGIGGAGAAKLAGAQAMLDLFTQVGLGQWFRYLTGILEVGGSIVLFIPSRAFWAALLLCCVMVGAIITHFTILHTPPTSPVVLLVLVAFVAWARRPAR